MSYSRTPEAADVRVVVASPNYLYVWESSELSFDQLHYVPDNPSDPASGRSWTPFIKVSVSPPPPRPAAAASDPEQSNATAPDVGAVRKSTGMLSAFFARAGLAYKKLRRSPVPPSADKAGAETDADHDDAAPDPNPRALCIDVFCTTSQESYGMTVMVRRGLTSALEEGLPVGVLICFSVVDRESIAMAKELFWEQAIKGYVPKNPDRPTSGPELVVAACGTGEELAARIVEESEGRAFADEIGAFYVECCLTDLESKRAAVVETARRALWQVS
ncbi:hypothetical protein HK405_006011 [Cladochytrium tenue]|nr:hypothetical protein HK405_006011 [Cladochytrium tenue]